MATVMVEISVDTETAEALADPRRRTAAAAGITDQDIDDELAAWKTKRAARRG